jgi:hypothetical protein
MARSFCETPGRGSGPDEEPGQDTLPLDIPVALIIPLELTSVQGFFCRRGAALPPAVGAALVAARRLPVVFQFELEAPLRSHVAR